jgi:nitrite reductase (NADH) large subunit
MAIADRISLSLRRRKTPSAKSIMPEGRLERVESSASALAEKVGPVVVVGGGPSGLRVAEELAKREIPVTLLNAERWQPYNRVKLTPFLAGEVQIGQVYQPATFAKGGPVKIYTGRPVVAIDRDDKMVITGLGRRFPYKTLVLCTGSRAHVPNIPGRELSGVYTFRNFDDVEALAARRFSARRVVVIGGGLLGLEAARGMAAQNIDTTVVEHMPHLMARQLDDGAGALLDERIRTLGVDVRTSTAVKAIEGNSRVQALQLSSGERLAADTVIICTGVRANIELARDAGLSVDQGIRVDDLMRTADPAIFAVGECAEHDGHVYGLISPCLEQAAICAAAIVGETGRYQGSLPSTKLKVVGVDVFSMGDVEQLDQRRDVSAITWQDTDPDSEASGAAYRLLALRRGRLIGALGIGEWPEVNRLQQAIRDQARVWPWQRWRFEHYGRLYSDRKPASVRDWPATATVCNCTGVSRGRLGEAIAQGCATIDTLRRETGASSVCGSCKPDLLTLLAMPAKKEAVFGWRAIILSSIIAVLTAFVAIILPTWPFSQSVQMEMRLDLFWIDGFWKQVSGFTLLALALVAGFLSIRKRVAAKWLGGYDGWRILHVVIGALSLGVLFLHSGFNLGVNLNLALMISFLALVLIGGAAGLITSIDHHLGGGGAVSKRLLVWLHIIAFWPLPLLLTVHVISSYAY